MLRGVLFDALRATVGHRRAVALTSLAFALMHVPLYGWHVVPLDLAVGVWLAGLRLLSGGRRGAGHRPRPGRSRDMVAVMRDRRVALRGAGASAGLAIVAVQRIAPSPGPPLYDGVIVVEPYRWLVPPPGQVGDPTSASGDRIARGRQEPDHRRRHDRAAATGPDLRSRAALLILPTERHRSRCRSADPAAVLPADGHIAGNVYRILVTNQAGVPLTAPASARVTIVLRGPETEPQVTMAQFGPDGWVPLETTDAGFGSTHLAVVTSFGDFTLIAPGPGGPYPTAAGSASSSPAASGGANPGSAVLRVHRRPRRPPASRPSRRHRLVGSASGGPPIALLAAIVAVLLLGIIGLSGLRRRTQRRRPYRGARPRRR